ncbi:GntR family transcriptional regulator [Nonomuraea endophytica]|uniref:GntR family transcriptional regulator n=1 Tax=Nonomuraea endophytica TaxID=714136 RepID=UPI0037CBF75D
MPATPRYLEIAADLRHKIRSEMLLPGEQLPTIGDLKSTYSVAVGTVQKALDKLTAEGLITGKQGRGNFVREHIEYVRKTGNRYSRKFKPNLQESEDGGWQAQVAAELSQVMADKDVARLLEIEPGDYVSKAVYTWMVSGECVQISTQYEPLDLTRGTLIETPATGDVNQPDVITRYDSIGIYTVEVKEDIRARPPSPEEEQAMRLPAGVPVFELERTHYAEVPLKLPGAPMEIRKIEASYILLRADRWVISNVQKVPR